MLLLCGCTEPDPLPFPGPGTTNAWVEGLQQFEERFARIDHSRQLYRAPFADSLILAASGPDSVAYLRLNRLHADSELLRTKALAELKVYHAEVNRLVAKREVTDPSQEKHLHQLYENLRDALAEFEGGLAKFKSKYAEKVNS